MPYNNKHEIQGKHKDCMMYNAVTKTKMHLPKISTTSAILRIT